MKRSVVLGSTLIFVFLLATGGTRASAASITVGLDGGPPGTPPKKAELNQGESVVVNLYLSLDPGPPTAEVASGFEGSFLYSSSGTWDVAVGSCGGSTWTSGAQCNGLADRVNLSLTSNNTGGERLLVTLTLTRNSNDSGDSFGIALAPGFSAFRDIDEAPFVLPVPINTTAGTVLALATPEPGTLGLLAGPLLALAAAKRQPSRRPE